MSAAEILKMAHTAGISIEIDGDDLVLEAHTPPASAVLDLLSRHKSDIIAMLHWQSRHSKVGPAKQRRTTRTVGRGGPAEEADTGCRGAFPHRVCANASGGPSHAKVDDDLLCRIVAALGRLPASRDHSGRRLIVATLTFVRSHWFSEALKYGWSLEALFGVDRNTPLDRYECWGLIVGLALAPKRPLFREQIGAGKLRPHRLHCLRHCFSKSRQG